MSSICLFWAHSQLQSLGIVQQTTEWKESRPYFVREEFWFLKFDWRFRMILKKLVFRISACSSSIICQISRNFHRFAILQNRKSQMIPIFCFNNYVLLLLLFLSFLSSFIMESKTAHYSWVKLKFLLIHIVQKLTWWRLFIILILRVKLRQKTCKVQPLEISCQHVRIGQRPKQFPV